VYVKPSLQETDGKTERERQRERERERERERKKDGEAEDATHCNTLQHTATH